jgi:hypothetical protein
MSTPTGAPATAPRRFRLRSLDAGVMFKLLFGGIWLLVGGGITIAFTAGGGPVWDDVILDQRGVAADATPTAVEPTHSSVNDRAVFRIVYTFTDRDGVARTSSTGTTDGRLLAGARRHERMSIEYDPQAPQRSRVSGESASFFGWFILLPLAFAAVGAVIAGRGLRRLLRVRRTYVHGHAILADVTGVAPTSMRINSRRVIRVDYSFKVITGRVTGQTTSLNPPAIGAQIWVLYLPSAPEHNVAA